MSYLFNTIAPLTTAAVAAAAAAAAPAAAVAAPAAAAVLCCAVMHVVMATLLLLQLLLRSSPKRYALCRDCTALYLQLKRSPPLLLLLLSETQRPACLPPLLHTHAHT